LERKNQEIKNLNWVFIIGYKNSYELLNDFKQYNLTIYSSDINSNINYFSSIFIINTVYPKIDFNPPTSKDYANFKSCKVKVNTDVSKVI